MTATDAQVRILMRERKKGRTQEQAAAKANLKSRKTAAKYERLGLLPSQLKKPRTYRTRPDAFAEDWPQIEQMLSDAPELEAKALFEWLQEEQPGKYQNSQLRTFQRRIARWRALNQPQIATLAQLHEPGEIMEMDGTWLTKLGVTIQGQSFKHMLIHCVLSYSNWEWGRVVQSESLGAVRLGLQSSLIELGYVPRILQTDNSSAATRQLGIREGAEENNRRTYTRDYLHLLDHYGLEPQTIHLDNPNENADVESSHGALKRALKQELLLRGSRDFEDIEAYEAGSNPIPYLELEQLCRHLDLSINHFVDDQHGPLRRHEAEQRLQKIFDGLNVDMQTFLANPTNVSYLETAKTLSEMDVGRLRQVAESLLEITF